MLLRFEEVEAEVISQCKPRPCDSPMTRSAIERQPMEMQEALPFGIF